jgi:hypothetical protein
MPWQMFLDCLAKEKRLGGPQHCASLNSVIYVRPAVGISVEIVCILLDLPRKEMAYMETGYSSVYSNRTW